MERDHKLNFKKQVLIALHKRTINNVEAKECIKRGFGNIELPLFFDFKESDPMRAYILALEKMEIIEPLFRTDGSI